jgi:hypothetical protein
MSTSSLLLVPEEESFSLQYEEYPMTFQIGLLGADGFVLASDTKATFLNKTLGGRTDANTHKIVVGADLVCAYSQDDFGLKVATEMAKISLPAKENWADVHEILTNCANDTWRAHVPKKYDGTPGSNVTPRVIACCLAPCPDRLWLIDVKESSDVRPITDKCYGGDLTNAAVFWGDRFYSVNSLQPVSNLTLLAAHSILMAHELNRQFVDGLEIYVAQGTPGQRWTGDLLSSDKLNKLRMRSKELDDTLKSSIFSSTAL